MLKPLLITAAMAGLVFPVAAADLGYYEPIDIPLVQVDPLEHDWSGFYAGLVGSYGLGNVRKVDTGTGIVTDIPLRGSLIGGTAGFNAQFGSVVAGVEGDLMWSGLSGSAPCTANPAYRCNANVDYIGTLRGRIGVAYDSALLFATGGVAIAGGRGSTTPIGPGTFGPYEPLFVGWTVGAGAEVAVADAVSVKVQYDYIDLGSQVAPAGTLGFAGFTASPIIHLIKVGANYHF